MWGDLAIAFLLAFITAFVVTPYTIKHALKVGAIDKPNKRKVNKDPVPRIGGVAIVVAFITSALFLMISMVLEEKINLHDYNHYSSKLTGFFIGIIIIAIFGYIDDLKDMKAWQKLTVQIIVACIMYAFHIRIDTINEQEISTTLSFIITVIWIVGITNAINLLDGLDGLSAGTTLISCVFLLIIFATNGSSALSMVLITALAGAVTGFLPFNVYPAKTFMGDVGAQFLGFSISIISIFGVAKTVTLLVLMAPVLILGLPIIDTIMAITRRLKKGKSLKSVFKADKRHLHHTLMRRGYTQKQAVTLLYIMSALLGMFAIILIYDGILKSIAFVVIAVILILIGKKGIINYEKETLRKNRELGLVDTQLIEQEKAEIKEEKRKEHKTKKKK